MALDLALKILLVEDAATMRKMEIRILKQLGFENVLEAVDGDDAIAKLQMDDTVRLVISDWSMPEMDGYALLLHLRGSADRAGLPFIMATGQGDKEHVAQAMDALKDFGTKANQPIIEAVGSVGKLKAGLDVLSAGLIGWDIGTWARDQFQVVYQAGVALAAGLTRASSTAVSYRAIWTLRNSRLALSCSRRFELCAVDGAFACHRPS